MKHLLSTSSDKQDANIELLRLLACLGVIFIHLPDNSGGIFSYKRLFDVLNACAVPVFFSITGCFWFRTRRSYPQLILHFIRTVLFPLIICVTVAQMLRTWIYSPMLELPLGMIEAPYPEFTLRGILRFDFAQWYHLGGHVWYVTAMMELLVLYLPMKLAARCEDKKTRYTILAMVFASVMLYNLNANLPYEMTFFLPAYTQIFPSYFVMLMIGQEMYENKHLYVNRKHMALIGLALLVLILGIRHIADDYNNPAKPALNIISIFSFMALIAIYLTVMPLRIPEKAAKVIRLLSSFTYGVYLIHPMFLTKLTYLGMVEIVAQKCEHLTPVMPLNYAIYAVICVGIVFLFCLVTLMICRIVWNLLRNAFSKLLPKRSAA